MTAKPVNVKTCLIFGGARSGKSRRAEEIVDHLAKLHAGACKVYIATAEVFDDEMAARVAKHRARRDESWTTRDVPLDLAETLERDINTDDIVLVDCLTLWLSNLMGAELDVVSETEKLLNSIAASPARLVFVSNEVGHGIVPDNVLARRFRDAQGLLNQKIAASVAHVEFVAAGLPLQLKP